MKKELCGQEKNWQQAPCSRWTDLKLQERGYCVYLYISYSGTGTRDSINTWLNAPVNEGMDEAYKWLKDKGPE